MHSPGEALVLRTRDKLTREETALLRQLDPARLPSHVAIIMDGNGRWAKKRGFISRIRGHEAGIESVRVTVRACGELHLKALTLYAFSVENWQRPRKETDALMKLLERFLTEEIPELNDNNVRLTTSGRIEDLPPAVRRALDHTLESTSRNTGLVLNLALSYGGRTEIIKAVREIAQAAQNREIVPEEIDENYFALHLYNHQLGDPDLLIRTSGEFRISNFLLWQIAYTEVHIAEVLWPEFRRAHLYRALLDFEKRDRRFGKVSSL
jgi:undecaprenyl diphosphate synthase